MNPSKLINEFLRILDGIKEGIKYRSIGTIENELKEMEGAFGLLLFSSILGIPSIPTFIGLSLLPYMEKELLVMLTHFKYEDDLAAQWFDIADI